MKNTRQSAIQKRQGIPLQSLIIAMIIIAALISFSLLYSMYRTTEGYDVMRSATQDYIDCQTSAFNLQAGSTYLTEQARSFVVTGDTEKAILYFNEVLVTKRRDRAVEEVRAKISDERALNHLTTALRLSNTLMDVECYAMRLVVDAMGDNLARYPEPLQAVVISEADSALSPEDKMLLARTKMFDSYYENMVGQITTRVSLCIDELVDSTLGQQISSTEHLLTLLRSQQLLIGALMFSLLLIAVVIFLLVISPLKRQISHISNEQMLEEEGTSELRFLARTYNAMYEQTRMQNEKLNYEANHDPLTGLYNRAAYDRVREEYRDEDIALLLIDVDNFKSFNDTYGHDVGDKVLCRVADVLRSSFRGEDMVCRIGGDEFSVIMVHATSELTELVHGKITRAADKLAHPTDDVPPVTLSVGVAFADGKSENEDLFKNADRALYQIKMAGRNGCGFYASPKQTGGNENA